MKIAHFTTAFLPTIGGAEIAVHNVALEQHESGHDVTVVVTWRSWKAVGRRLPYRVVPLLPRSIGAVMRAERYGLDGRWVVGTQLAFYQQVFNFDAWHVTMAYAAGHLAAPFIKRVAAPSMLTCQGIGILTVPEVGYGYRLDPDKDRAIRQAFTAYDRVCAISPSMREELLGAGVPASRIVDVSNGADVERIGALPVDREAVRARRGWEDRFVVLTVGRNHPVKGYTYIPEVVAQVVPEHPRLLWVIVGKKTASIAAKARRLGVAEYVQVVPQIGLDGESGASEEENPQKIAQVPDDKLVRIYKAADAFGFPTLSEAFGVVLVEAMAAGLPIVTTDAPGARDAVEHGETGLISPVRDAGAMAENVLRLMDDPPLQEKLGRHAEREAVARYRWSDVAQQYVDTYQDMIHSKQQ